ncbi:MAG: VOC family protein [Ignavibacteriae bacterium]|nr:VOC family protein [Ignavibacteriota bacterium]MCB9208548.1 VOC family protein [Ignavibacteriales bacterium]MCB9258343.1 VOC family protein [Ignavibacteriales bacterium]
MKTIMPNLWFDKNAEEAVNFYTSLFSNSKIGSISRFEKEGFEHHQMPEGTVMTMEFEIEGKKFLALNGGPIFKFNESVSFFVYCESETEIENLYKTLSEGGSVNMPLDKYDWSEKYAWVKDKFGISWQLDITNMNTPDKIVPALLFVNDKFSMVKHAVNHYTNIFPKSKVIFEAPNLPMENIPGETLAFAQFSLNGNLFNAMSGQGEHNFDFNEAVSFIIQCDSQDEVNYYWEKLTEGGTESMCGWLKDKFRISWQVVPAEMFKYINGPDKAKSRRAMNAMFQMKKLDIELFKKAYEGN